MNNQMPFNGPRARTKAAARFKPIRLGAVALLTACLFLSHGVAQNTLPNVVVPPSLHPDWTSFVNTSYVQGIAVSGDEVWLVGGGVKRLNLKTGEETIFTTEHGLASNDTRAVAILNDSVWIATTGGLSRYLMKEGSWQTFTAGDGLADDMVVSMTVDPKNQIVWLGTWDSGLAAYEVANKRWRHYSVKDGLSNQCVTSLALDRETDALLIGTWGGGINRLNLSNGTLENWTKSSNLASKVITSIGVENESIWAGTLVSGLYRYSRKGGDWEKIDDSKVTTREVSQVLVEDFSKRIWVGSKKNGLFGFARDSGSWTHHVKDGISALATEDQEHLLLGTWGNGLTEYAPQTSPNRSLSKRDHEIAHNRIVTLFAAPDREELWLGTEGGGAASYDFRTGRWPTRVALQPRPDDGTVNAIISLPQINETWLGTIDGIIRLQMTEEGESRETIRELPNALVESFALDNRSNILWVGTHREGLHRYDLKKGTWAHAENFPHYILHDISWDEDDEQLWCATEEGVVIYQPSREKISIPGPPAGTEIRSILVDHHRAVVWAGTWGRGLYRYDKTKDLWKHYSRLNSDLPGDSVVGLALRPQSTAEDAMWVGTDYGAAFFDEKAQQWRVFRTSDGLAHRFILAVAVDHEGSVWFGTWGGGLSRYRKP